MRKIIILISLVIIAAASWGQAKPAADTAWLPKTDTTEFICLSDLNTYLVELSGKTTMTPIEFLKFREAINEIINRTIIRKRKPK